jgi:hypothetical protein
MEFAYPAACGAVASHLDAALPVAHRQQKKMVKKA